MVDRGSREQPNQLQPPWLHGNWLRRTALNVKVKQNPALERFEQAVLAIFVVGCGVVVEISQIKTRHSRATSSEGPQSLGVASIQLSQVCYGKKKKNSSSL